MTSELNFIICVVLVKFFQPNPNYKLNWIDMC